MQRVVLISVVISRVAIADAAPPPSTALGVAATANEHDGPGVGGSLRLEHRFARFVDDQSLTIRAGYHYQPDDDYRGLDLIDATFGWRAYVGSAYASIEGGLVRIRRRQLVAYPEDRWDTGPVVVAMFGLRFGVLDLAVSAGIPFGVGACIGVDFARW